MIRLSLAAATAILVVSSPALADSKTIAADAFTGVEISSGIQASIVVGGAQSVVAESANAADFDELRVEVRNGVFHAWYDWNILGIFNFSDRDIKLTISVPALESIESNSGSSVDVSGLAGDVLRLVATSGARLSAPGIAGAEYKVEATSGAAIALDGSCTKLEAEVTTGSSLAAKDLLCSDVWGEVTTGASFTATASGTIGGDVTTGARLTIYGGPEVKNLETSTGGAVDFPG